MISRSIEFPRLITFGRKLKIKNKLIIFEYSYANFSIRRQTSVQESRDLRPSLSNFFPENTHLQIQRVFVLHLSEQEKEARRVSGRNGKERGR